MLDEFKRPSPARIRRHMMDMHDSLPAEQIAQEYASIGRFAGKPFEEVRQAVQAAKDALYAQGIARAEELEAQMSEEELREDREREILRLHWSDSADYSLAKSILYHRKYPGLPDRTLKAAEPLPPPPPVRAGIQNIVERCKARARGEL